MHSIEFRLGSASPEVPSFPVLTQNPVRFYLLNRCTLGSRSCPLSKRPGFPAPTSSAPRAPLCSSPRDRFPHSQASSTRARVQELQKSQPKAKKSFRQTSRETGWGERAPLPARGLPCPADPANHGRPSVRHRAPGKGTVGSLLLRSRSPQPAPPRVPPALPAQPPAPHRPRVAAPLQPHHPHLSAPRNRRVLTRSRLKKTGPDYANNTAPAASH